MEIHVVHEMNRNEVVNEKKNNIVYFFNQIPILIKLKLPNWMPYQLTLRLMSLKRQKKQQQYNKFILVSMSVKFRKE